MRTFSKLLRGSCAIATSGALVLANFAAIAEELPPVGAPPLPPAAQEALPPGAQQPGGPGSQQVAPERLGQGQLEKLLAPIALYPDDLVAQILTASTYPIEVVAAARWVNEHPNVHGDGLRDAMAQQPWDASVKGLTAVPQVLAMMNDRLDWMQELGEAFLAQGDDVTNAIQQLRGKAQANGNLKSSDKIKVSTIAPPGPPPPPGPVPVGADPALLPPPPPPEYIMIEPVDPGVYYVPIYDPYVVYGPWLWPAYTPFYWYPPGYVVGAAVIGFGVGFVVGSALWCHYNWGWHGGGWYGGAWHGGGPVTINVNRYNQFNRTNIVADRNGFSNWQFNAAHRGTVGYQNAALRQQFGGTNLHGPQGNFQHTLQGSQGGLQGNLHGPLQGSQGGLQGNLHGPLQGNTNVNTNTKFNTNANVNRNVNVNTNSKGNTNANGNTNAKLDSNANVNRNVNANTNTNVNRNVNANTNANFNRNVNANANANTNVNRNQNVNRNVNVNRNINVNRNFNAGGNFNRGGGNVTRNAGAQGGNNKKHP